MSQELNPRQLRFIDGYLSGKSAKQAYIDAGYTSRASSAESEASKLIRNPKVQAAIQAARDKAANRFEATESRVLAELARVAFFRLTSLYNPDGTLKAVSDIDPDSAAALAALETIEEREAGKDGAGETITQTRKVKAWDKLRALELLGKRLGMWTDKLDLTTGGKALPSAEDFKAVPDDELRRRIAEIEGRIGATGAGGTGGGPGSGGQAPSE